jgi:NAD(P)-dependent dehydrogenase (short-subunit alcohol dehydrogenase family)
MAGKLLQGQISLVTGASKGIGAAIARKFADNGATLAITGLPKEGLKDVRQRNHSLNLPLLRIPRRPSLLLKALV